MKEFVIKLVIGIVLFGVLTLMAVIKINQIKKRHHKTIRK